MKSKRQNEIIEIISSADIETQEELAAALRERGYPITQATVSRDIRELRLIKVASKSGGYKYAKPVRHEVAVYPRRLHNIQRHRLAVRLLTEGWSSSQL